MKAGEKLLPWELEGINGEAVPSIEDYKGKPLLILFFYLGCPGCKGRAIPFANRMVFEKRGVEVIGIHSRFEGGVYTDEEILQAKEDFFIRFPVFKDKFGANTFYKYKAGGTPHWILTDADHNVVQSMFGSDPNNALLRIDYKVSELQDAAKSK